VRVSLETAAAESRSAFECALALASSQFATIERLSALNINAGKAVVEESVLHTRRLLDAGDLAEWIGASTAAAQPSMEKSLAYWRSVYAVLAQSHAEMSRLVQDHAEQVTDRTLVLADAWSEKSTRGSSIAIDSYKRLVTGARSAFATLSRLSQQAGGVADTAFTAAMNGVKISALKPIGTQ